MIKRNVNLSVVIPLYNEEKRFPKSFKKIDDFFSKKKFKLEYILIDDGSTDKTLQAIKKLKSRHPIIVIEGEINRGKGGALKLGVEKARGKYIFFTDADLSTPIEEFDKLLPFLDKFNMVIGSRRLKNSSVEILQPFHRRFLGSIFYIIFSIFFTKNIQDTNCGFKAYRNKSAKLLYRKIFNNRWGFDAELIYLAQKYNIKIKEIPVIWLNDPFSRVSTISASFYTVWELLKIKFNDFIGAYEKR